MSNEIDSIMVSKNRWDQLKKDNADLRTRLDEMERKVKAWDSTVHRVKTLRARGTGRIMFVHEITQHVEWEMSKMPLEEIPTNDAKA